MVIPTDVTDHIYHIAPENPFDFFFDCYCGGGGSGSGILSAYQRMGRNPYGTFVNHWDKAIDIHGANHPTHRHLKEDLFLLDPHAVMPTDVPYSLGWASPSCQQFSLSRGNRPINEQGRSHADTVVEWVEHCKPVIQIVENVRQFRDWCRLKQRRCKGSGELQWAKEVPGKKKGSTKIIAYSSKKHPLPAEHVREKDEPEAEWELRMLSLGYARHLEPDMAYRGEYFDAWILRIKALGYYADWKLIRSADHGDPTIRERLFVQFVRIDSGKRICWPDQRYIKPDAKRPEFKTNKNRRLYPWPTAFDSVIDFDIKGTSMFLKDLAPATKRRIAIGLVKFGLKQFFVPASNFGGNRVRGVDLPVCTLQCNHRGEGLAEPVLMPFALTSNKGWDCGVRGLNQPAATLTCNSRGEGLAEPSAWLMTKQGINPNIDPTRPIDYPVPAILTDGRIHLCAAETFSVRLPTEPWLIPNFGERPGQEPRTHTLSMPLPAVTSHGAGGLCEAYPFMVQFAHGSAKPEDCARRVSDGEVPLPAITTSNSEALATPVPFILPKDQGHKGDYVTSIHHPCCTVQTTAHDHLAEPCIIQLNGCSTAISAHEPLGAVTGMPKQYVMEPRFTLPMFTAQLRGTGRATPLDKPLHALSAQGQHELLAEAFLLVLDNAGKNGAGQRAYSTKEPVKTIPVKANQTLAEPSLTPVKSGVRFTLETLEDAIHKVAPTGVDVRQVVGLLVPLMEELRKIGRADVKPWVYVYYGSGAVGADINTPMPTIRTKEGSAVCYPVLEFDGQFLLLDVLYRMLTVKELQRAQGFPDDFVWPPGITQSDMVKAIGNSVSCGVAEALTLAVYSQSEDISAFFPEELAA